MPLLSIITLLPASVWRKKKVDEEEVSKARYIKLEEPWVV